MSVFDESYELAFRDGVLAGVEKGLAKLRGRVRVEKKEVIVTKTVHATPPQALSNMMHMLNALTAISTLKDNPNLRSWRGKEAVRVAAEVLEYIKRPITSTPKPVDRKEWQKSRKRANRRENSRKKFNVKKIKLAANKQQDSVPVLPPPEETIQPKEMLNGAGHHPSPASDSHSDV